MRAPGLREERPRRERAPLDAKQQIATYGAYLEKRRFVG